MRKIFASAKQDFKLTYYQIVCNCWNKTKEARPGRVKYWELIARQSEQSRLGLRLSD
jgi:hypothetical protein